MWSTKLSSLYLFKSQKHRARFLKKIDVSNISGCWLWRGQKLKKNGPYGRIRISKNKHLLAHRISFANWVGDIPDDQFICHSCDNPSCVRPDHLFSGYPLDNSRDMFKKGRQSAQMTKKDKCMRGHPLSGSNINKNGKCKACDRLRYLRTKSKTS